jgi:hypothetical protein
VKPAAARKATPAAKAKQAGPATRKPTAKTPAKTAATAKTPPPTASSAAPSSPPPPPAGWASPQSQPSGGDRDLIGTAVQAVGEIAQIGLTLGGQALKQALSRLPKP